MFMDRPLLCATSAGLEPAAYSLGKSCSIQLSYEASDGVVGHQDDRQNRDFCAVSDSKNAGRILFEEWAMPSEAA